MISVLPESRACCTRGSRNQRNMAEIQSRVLARAVATATRDALARRESIALLHGSEAAEVMKSKRAGGMDAGLLAVSVEVGKIRQLQDGKWYVHCKHCAQETTLQARNEEEAYGMLNERKWRLSMPGKKYEKRNWSCPSCAELWSKDTTPTATVLSFLGASWGRF